MGEAIGQVLPLAVGVAVSPVRIVAVVLMLVTPRARVNGPAFVVGWIVGLGIVGAIVLGVADPAGATSDGQPATWVDGGVVARDRREARRRGDQRLQLLTARVPNVDGVSE